MTSKDYNRAAKQIREHIAYSSGPDHSAAIISSFVQFFSSDNPKFDGDKFIKQCEK